MDTYSARTLTHWLDDAYYNELATSAARIRAPVVPLLLVVYAESGHRARAVFRDKRMVDVVDGNGNPVLDPATKKPRRKLKKTDPRDPSLGYPTAIGLNQITPVRAKAMGMSEEQRLAMVDMTEREQLPLLVRAFDSTGYREPYTSAGHLYLCNFAPAHLRHAYNPAHRIFAKDIDQDSYRWNAPLDLNKDGYITVGELSDWLEHRASEAEYCAHLARLENVLG